MTGTAPSPPLRLEGKRLYLRPIKDADAGPRYLGWMRDPDVVRYLEARFSEQTLEGLSDYVRAQLVATDVSFLAIVLKQGDRHIGNIKLGPVDRPHRRSDMGILLGERDCWGQGLAREAIELLSEHAFAALGIRKLTAGAYASNHGSIRAFEKAGFVIEARLRSHYRCGDEYVDGVLMARFAAPARTALEP